MSVVPFPILPVANAGRSYDIVVSPSTSICGVLGTTVMVCYGAYRLRAECNRNNTNHDHIVDILGTLLVDGTALSDALVAMADDINGRRNAFMDSVLHGR